MKGIIVLDVPEECRKCPFQEVSEENHMWCLVSYLDDCSRVSKMILDEYSKPDWCPIKEIPARLEEIKLPNTKNGHKMEGFSTGFNACLDEIEGKMQSD